MFLGFLAEFFGVFAKGFVGLFVSTNTGYGGLLGGLYQMFNIPQYIAVIDKYSAAFGTGEWVALILIIIALAEILLCIFIFVIRTFIKFFKRNSSQAAVGNLLDEVDRLDREIRKKDKQLELFAKGRNVPVVRVGHTGLYASKKQDDEEKEESKVNSSESRFYKLTEVDKEFSENAPTFVYDDKITLKEICSRFRNWACSEMKLYYEPRVIRLFFSSLATTRIIILQGISGTGKTSLPYALGQWFNNPATIASVQPSWRDRTEIFGYFNEFTKRFNETQILKKMYEAKYNEQIYLTVIDEANIARVEYYFAELLSILEMPSRDNWIVDICPSGWDSDPKFIEKGRFKLPENMWFVCTINNDDSTFAISDKVYDRAIPININSKGIPFEVSEEDRDASNICISYKYLENMFKEAQVKYKVSEENIKKFDEMDNYVIKHFRLAFGNRIVKQLKEFVPVYVACGGSEIDGLDYVLCNKILRKFESLNLAYIRDEIDGYIQYLNDRFGEENMSESKEYLERLKKLF